MATNTIVQTIRLNDLPLYYPAKVLAGDKYQEPHQFKLRGATSTSAISLSKATMTVVITDKPNGASLVTGGEIASVTSSATGIVIDSAGSGAFTVVVQPANTTSGSATTALSPGCYHYEVQAVFSTSDTTLPGLTKTLLSGPFDINVDAVA